MIFKDTKRFSPVIYENDLPWKEDLYFYDIKQIPKNVKEFEKFIDEWIDVESVIDWHLILLLSNNDDGVAEYLCCCI
jgi:hypothetical protein